MAYAIHQYPRVGVAKPTAVGAACGHGLHPSYSPDTPFSFFYSDAYSDYGDEPCLSSYEQLADAEALYAHLQSVSLADAETDCARVLTLWDASWYGTSLDGHFSGQSDPSRHASGPPPPPPTIPHTHRVPPIWHGVPSFDSSGLLTTSSSHFDRRHSLATPSSAASLAVPTDIRAQPVCSEAESAVSTSPTADTGTWKNRQFILSMPSSHSQDEAAALTSSSTQQHQQPSHARAPQDAAQPKPVCPPQTTEEEDDARVAAAAWRWRFTRRWKAEQARAVNPQLANSGHDGVTEALMYLAAAGANNADLSRTTSDVSEGGLRQCTSISTCETVGLLGTEYLQDPFSASSQPTMLAAADKQARASEQVAAYAKQAQTLLQAQRDLERRVEQRAREQQASPSWVGDLLDNVELDDWGKFRFVLLRVTDKEGRHKLILRGRNYLQEEGLASQCKRQVVDLAAKHHLQPGSVELQGSGVMEWRRDRDRHLHLSCTQVYPCMGTSLAPRDLGRTAAILAKKHLPMHYKVVSDGTFVG